MRRLFALILVIGLGSILSSALAMAATKFLAVNLLSFSNGRKMPAPRPTLETHKTDFGAMPTMVPCVVRKGCLV